MTDSPQPTPARRASVVRPLIVIVVAVALCTALELGVPALRGPWYWRWNLHAARPAMQVPAMILAAAPVFAAILLYHRTRRLWSAVALATAGAASLTLATSLLQPELGGWERTIRVVRSPIATSYFTDARRVLGPDSPLTFRDLLDHYPDVLPHLILHSQTKPPGPLLFHATLIRLFGPDEATSLLDGVLLLLLSLTSVPATAALVSYLTRDRDAGFYAAAFLAMCPGFLMFYPGLDAVYPAIACALIATWVAAVRTGKARYAVAFGALLALATFFTYVLLLLGTFLLGYAILALWVVPGWTVRRFLTQSAVASATIVAAYAGLWLLTGYDPIATFRVARFLADAQVARYYPRPYPATIGWDLYDLALGSGWISYVMILLFLARGRDVVAGVAGRDPAANRERVTIVWLALLTPVAAAISGRVPGETARVWQFMLPLLLIPVALELARWSPRARLWAYGSLWLALTVLFGRLLFVHVETLQQLRDYQLM